MNKTNIEWVKNPDGSQGYTWNPITGCLNHNDGLCKGGGFPCYAYKLAHGRLKQRYLRNLEIALPHEDPKTAFDDPFYPRFWGSRLYEPVNKIREWGRQRRVVHTQEPKGIFVCDMSDLFGVGIPEEWTRRVLDRFQYCPQHRFYLLTKQPANLFQFSPFPENCWVGVTATNIPMFSEAVKYLTKIKATVKYISFEPLLHWDGIDPVSIKLILQHGGINWVIIGAQTKPYKPPKIEWLDEIVRACDKAGAPVFLKDNLWKALVIYPGIPPKWARGNGITQDADCLRQEMPR